MEFIDLKAQYKAYKQEIDESVHRVLESGAFIMGAQVDNTQNDLASYTKSKYAMVCSSGSDALLLSMMALDIKAGDEIITTPFTFIATAEMIALLGAKPVFVDIDESTYNIDISQIESKITPQTKAIMPVSLYGFPPDMDKINAITKKHNIPVIEDACQSFGATLNGKNSCNLSTFGATSFFPSKPLGCYGDGGAVFCNDENLANKVKSLLIHGQAERYVHKYIGINGRLDAIQCAIISVKLKHLDDELQKRDEIAQCYLDNINGYILPKIPSGVRPAWAQFSIRSAKGKSREKILESLNAKGIPTAVHYPIPLHLQEALNHLGYKKGDFPLSEKVASEIFSIPFSPFLNASDQDKIIESLNKIGE